jgi:dipeptidyl aminopeptidase/acylaminoacyl peptidase
MTNKRVLKVIAVIGAILAMLAVLALFALSLYVYNANFGMRFETNPENIHTIDEYEGLDRQRYTFTSNKGQTLVGYRYFKDGGAKGLIVLAHGFGGGGHNDFMDFADYFASNGYTVFGYDATGNDESGGEGVGGMPQGAADLDYALRFVKESPDFAGLPIMLFGHSWGAYSSGSVLSLHPDVKAAVLGAGFNHSVDMFEEEGRRQAGSGVDMLLPFVRLIERVKFGRYASLSCVEGFNATSAGIMLIHSEDDAVVSFEKHFAMFERLYKDDPRFVFVRYEDRGHNGLFRKDGERDIELMARITAFYDSYL